MPAGAYPEPCSFVQTVEALAAPPPEASKSRGSSIHRGLPSRTAHARPGLIEINNDRRMRDMRRIGFPTIILLAASVLVSAQQERAASPAGSAATVVGGEWVKNAEGAAVYQGGKWIEITYSRPILRQRTSIFGTGADYGAALRAGAAVWRAGANQTTEFKTEVPLIFGSTKLPAGAYGLLVDLKSPTEWTLILTSQPRGQPQPGGGGGNPGELVGATNYNPKFDVVRAPMRVDSKAASKLDQMTIYFVDVTRTGGTLAIAWEHTVATVEFRVG